MTNRFVLIHGSWHGGWCWHKVAPLLRLHAPVDVVNLPGRGRDAAFLPTVTMSTMTRALSKSLSAEKVTVVAHSRSGVIATALAESFPDRIERVIYLAAFMLPSGHRAADWFKRDSSSRRASGATGCTTTVPRPTSSSRRRCSAPSRHGQRSLEFVIHLNGSAR